jgi:uncharacterized protein (TIGR02145 family)/uncharacterized repeat protein (TIGR02543 family)
MAFRGYWRPVPKYTVTFDPAGGNGGAAWLGSVKVDSGKAIGAAMMPGNPTKADSTFVGWFDGDARYTDKTVIVKAVTLTARWDRLVDSRDGKSYKTVTIGGQTWMAENLNYTPLSGNSWNSTTYGRLYDWNAAMNGSGSSNANPSGVQGICPDGWHLPSTAEWSALVDYVGSPAGTKLKSTSGWSGDGNGTDAYGFTALAGGTYISGGFQSTGLVGYWWTATEGGTSTAYWWRMVNSNVGVESGSGSSKSNGYSVRCVKD